MQFTTYGNILRQLVSVDSDEEVTETGLVYVPPLRKILYNGQEVITGFEFANVPRSCESVV